MSYFNEMNSSRHHNLIIIFSSLWIKIFFFILPFLLKKIALKLQLKIGTLAQWILMNFFSLLFHQELKAGKYLMKKWFFPFNPHFKYFLLTFFFAKGCGIVEERWE